MMDIGGLSEPVIRIAAFLAIFGSLAIYELWSPRLERAEMTGALKSQRWLSNLSMVLLSSLLLRIVFPAAAVGAALWAGTRGYGLFPALGIPPAFAGFFGFFVLDFIVWLEHVASHKVPLFWRIHRMHHADNGFDVTTALRFHPVEILLSMLWKAFVIVALGIPPIAVLLFEIVLNGMSMFNHANIRLNLRADNVMRAVVVTPDMHRVHHSVLRHETDSNYGFNFSFWDRMFGTYRGQPEAGHEAMEIGLPMYRGTWSSKLIWMLALPFRK